MNEMSIDSQKITRLNAFAVDNDLILIKTMKLCGKIFGNFLVNALQQKIEELVTDIFLNYNITNFISYQVGKKA